MPIDPVHTLEPGFDGISASKRRCTRENRVALIDAGAVPADVETKAAKGKEAGTEAQPCPETGMFGAREEASIRWALERGHGVELQVVTLKFTPGTS